MVAATPSACAAVAMPSPWLPALEATTPWESSSAFSDASAFVAPRILNDPVCCSHSILSQTSPPKKSERVSER